MARFLWFLPFLLFASHVRAVDYYWEHGPYTAPSASQLCKQVADLNRPGGQIVSNTSFSYQSGGRSAVCYMSFEYASSPGNTTTSTAGLSRVGDQCSPGTSYNEDIGGCKAPDPEPPKDCTSSLGTTTAALSQMTQLDGGVKPTNPAHCDNGCKAVYTSGGSTLCGPLKSDPSGPKYCIFKYTGTGEQCNGSESPTNAGSPYTPAPAKDPNDPTDPQNNCKGAGAVWSGTSCVKYWEPEKSDTGGTGTPGTGGTGGNTGGGGGGTSGPGGGSGTGTPKPGSDEDEKGNAGGGGGPKKDETGNEAGYSDVCNKPPVCEGDVFSCAILNQNHHDACQLVALPTKKEEQGRDQVISKQVEVLEKSQSELDSQVSGFMSGFTSAGGGGFGGTCYPDKQISVAGHSLSLPFSKACDPLIILRYGILAAAYLSAARILSGNNSREV